MRILLILLILISICGCKVNRNLSTTVDKKKTGTEQSVIKETKQIRNDSIVSQIANFSSAKTSDKEVIIRQQIDEYDTEKPADPLTGKPPVKKTIVTDVILKESNTEEAEQKDSLQSNVSKESFIDKTEQALHVTNETDHTVIKEKIKRKPVWINYLILLVIPAIYYLYRKGILSKFLLFLRKIIAN